jgi:hypothetical protein
MSSAVANWNNPSPGFYFVTLARRLDSFVVKLSTIATTEYSWMITTDRPDTVYVQGRGITTSGSTPKLLGPGIGGGVIL